MSPVALEAATAQSPVDLWHLPPEEPVLATPHPGRAAVTLGDTGSSPQPALAPTAETYKPDLKNLHKLQPVGGLCGNTFCQPVPVTAGFRTVIPSRHGSKPRKNSPSLLRAQQLEEAGGKANVCRTSASPAQPHLCRKGMTHCSGQGDVVAAATRMASSRAVPKPALSGDKHPAAPWTLPSHRTVVGLCQEQCHGEGTALPTLFPAASARHHRRGSELLACRDQGVSFGGKQLGKQSPKESSRTGNS